MKERQKLSLDLVEQWARRNPALVLICILVIISSAVVSLLDGVSGLRQVYLATFGRNARKYENIRALATSTHIDYFTGVLGPAAFRNQDGQYSEYIFVDTKFYVQAITSTNGKVLLYSVTTRSHDFTPSLDLQIPMATGDRHCVVVLGRTTFSDIPTKPIRIEGCAGAQRYRSYREKYYFGSAGRYQNYNFAQSDAGYGFDPDGDVSAGNVSYESRTGIDTRKLQPELMHFRRICPINTFAVSVPLSDIDDEVPFELGPSYYQVSVLE